ncbi:TrkH family potassium uptake protein [Roseospira visakhapatnamensis]|uniref:Trk system potassium uptake protein n=1 Tax=Roseospira visakhapatnamensis TaxID=390880 RepID=A0A7W6RB22_9PROT|nr:TrkH family potassium uptake protein [Roseospira visakhapatnamensis]MBB4265255.1 trk system potassium uptake protein TrkH [Roseospira visakhapatnamensis]
MIDLRPILLVHGLLLSILALGMVIPGLVDLLHGNPDWLVFVTSSALTGFFGVSLFLATRGGQFRFSIRQAFLMTATIWVILPAFAALPFVLTDPGLSYTDAFFEAMSGITTTGSTVMTGLDLTPPGILLWRAILQWLGGIGIIIMALSVLPMLRVGGMQMFKVEAFETQEKVLPRAASLASALAVIYVVLTAAWTVMLYWADMSALDSVLHAMTTISTGGYSSKDASVGHFRSWAVDWIITAGMIVGAIPFLLYLQAVRGRPMALLRDTQVQWFLGTAVVGVAMVAWWLWQEGGMDALNALRYAAFNTVSVMTGTGYATADYWQWGGVVGGAPVAVLFCLMFVGGCAGSTSCGIKVFRFQILGAMAAIQLRRLLQPSGVFIPYYNKKPIQEGVAEAVMAFFFMYALSVAFLAMLLGMTGLDHVTAISGAATAISNVGPGLGDVIGPAGNFSTLPDTAKWLLSAGMLLGRLELFTVLVLLMPRFWRD